MMSDSVPHPSDSNLPRLSAKGLSKSYPTSGEPLCVLVDISLDLSKGESVAIVGPSGSGKSTLLQILGTLDSPDQGDLRIDGQDPFALDAKGLAHFRNQTVGFIFQDHHLLPQLTVFENVLVPTLASGKPGDDQLDRAADLLRSVGLSERESHVPSQLSGGERERVAIARALLMNPALILADEPTGNLDRRTADAVTNLLLELQSQSGAVLVTVTHSEVLANAMQQKMELLDGRLVNA